MSDERCPALGKDVDLLNMIVGLAHQLARKHEAATHNGEPCGGERALIVAILAHSLGLVGEDFFAVLRRYLAEMEHERLKAEQAPNN